jgi:hypothetical protein
MLRFASREEALQHLSDITGSKVKIAGVGYELYSKGADRIAVQTKTVKEAAEKLAKATRENRSLKTRKKHLKALESMLNTSMKELEGLKRDVDNLEGYKTASAEDFQYNEEDYKYYVVRKNKIDSGWEYQEDAKDQQNEIKEERGESSKVLQARGVKQLGLNPDSNDDWITGKN